MNATLARSEPIAFRSVTKARLVTKPQSVAVALIGPGGVGSALLEQWRAVQSKLEETCRKTLELRAICNSKRMFLSGSKLSIAQWDQLLSDSTESPDFGKLTYFLHQHVGDVVIIDITASPEVASMHSEWLQCGFKVITANKHGMASNHCANIRRAEKLGGGSYFCETTVGAGLPILGVLTDLVRTGDDIQKIEGVLSGTLSHLMRRVGNGEKFSHVLRDLHATGYTEPDPRIDLSGMDVARKAVILGRMAGIDLSLSDVEVESLVPIEGCSALTVSQFISRCEVWDDQLARSAIEARSKGCVLQYVATITRDGKARVAPVRISNVHQLAQIPAGDNLVSISSRRYAQSPLVIQGPGAGREVTAAGLLADLIRLAD